MRVTRRRHPLEGRSLQVLGGMRRHGVLELLLVLPDGSKSLVPAAWTDIDQSAVVDEQSMATLGSLSDLLHTCELVADLVGRELWEQGQAAGKSPCKEDSRAACPAQSDARPTCGATAGSARPAPAAAGPRGDHAAGQADRQDRRRAEGARR